MSPHFVYHSQFSHYVSHYVSHFVVREPIEHSLFPKLFPGVEKNYSPNNIVKLRFLIETTINWGRLIITESPPFNVLSLLAELEFDYITLKSVKSWVIVL